MRIRKAKISDAKKISYLIQTTLKKVNYKDYPKEVLRWLVKKNSPKSVEESIMKRDFFCLIEKNRILGVVSLEGNKMGKLFIRHNYIGRGFGKKLMNFIEDYARKKGIKTIKLFPTKTALGMYKKYGYKSNKYNIWKVEGYEIKVPIMKKRLI
ncbi:MAG: GNAT family N-acetyltransferase [Candidatus Pacearchaeota archaeon]